MPENENSAALAEYDYPDSPPDGTANGVNPETIQEVIALSGSPFIFMFIDRI